jgi:hypothetical protein
MADDKLTLINGKLRIDKSGGRELVLSPKPGGSAPCCCAKGYEFCIINSNFIKDNSWDVYVNDNKLGNYSGAPNTNVCFSIEPDMLNDPGENTLKFMLVACTFDDYFQFVVREKSSDGTVNGKIIYSGDSGFINGSFQQNGTCSTTSFTRTFNL